MRFSAIVCLFLLASCSKDPNHYAFSAMSIDDRLNTDKVVMTDTFHVFAVTTNERGLPVKIYFHDDVEAKFELFSDYIHLDDNKYTYAARPWPPPSRLFKSKNGSEAVISSFEMAFHEHPYHARIVKELNDTIWISHEIVVPGEQTFSGEEQDIDFRIPTQPRFDWTELSRSEDVMYYQVMADRTGEIFSVHALETTTFRFYEGPEVLFNFNKQITQPELIEGLEYYSTIYGVDSNNHANWSDHKKFYAIPQ